jgi:uncharacterized phage protein (TIGR02216 family)
MEIGLGHLRLGPGEFWRMTLPELAAAARGVGLARGGAEAMSRSTFDELLRRNPDL